MRFISSTSKKFCLKIVYYYFLFSFFLQVRLKRIFHFDKKFMKCKLPAFWTLCYERIQVKENRKTFWLLGEVFQIQQSFVTFCSWHQWCNIHKKLDIIFSWILQLSEPCIIMMVCVMINEQMTAHYTENVLVKNEKTCISLHAKYATFNVLLKITLQKNHSTLQLVFKFNFCLKLYFESSSLPLNSLNPMFPNEVSMQHPSLWFCFLKVRLIQQPLFFVLLDSWLHRCSVLHCLFIEAWPLTFLVLFT